MTERLSRQTLRRIRSLTGQRVTAAEIARALRLSTSLVHKVRQGQYDARLAKSEATTGPAARQVVWCQRCRCHCEGTCRVCALRNDRAGTALRPRAPLPPGIRDERLLEKLQLPLAQAGLAQRIVNRLDDHNILTVNDLLHCRRAELLAIPQLGRRALQQILRAMARLGFGSAP